MKKQLTGKVKSDKMTGTASVVITHFKIHPVYSKRIKKTKSYLADNTLSAKIGDEVIIESTRPLSKLKAWKIIKIKKQQLKSAS